MASARDILEELHLLKCSLLPGEILSFTEASAVWETLLETYSFDPDAELPLVDHAVQFEVKAEDSDVWFGVQLLPGYKEEGVTSVVSVKGDNLGRAEQERWQAVVAEAIEEVTGSECVSARCLRSKTTDRWEQIHSLRVDIHSPPTAATRGLGHPTDSGAF